ncbi:conserved protein [Methanosarcina mazei Go1]|uniref:Conserved protein n=1 Tax=Methanosarcina mazei (strain ATCC BAA-159 / DSM 3647 / Goe1 / Go1 / JCM 11833 / OCM 88) TaxID=192952 RepID=Q8PT55_METMA|nr:conserved protein [Methanosarcina mazei Go1]
MVLCDLCEADTLYTESPLSCCLIGIRHCKWPEIRSFAFYKQNMLLTAGNYSSGQYLLVLMNHELNQANYSAEKFRLK